MKKNTKTPRACNASPETNKTSDKANVPEVACNSATDAAHRNHRKIVKAEDGIGLACFACFVEGTVEQSLKVLQIVRVMISNNAKPAEIKEGIEIAEFALGGLLEEFAAKHHGEGLPKGNIPVRGIPYVVTPPKGDDQPPEKVA